MRRCRFGIVMGEVIPPGCEGKKKEREQKLETFPVKASLRAVRLLIDRPLCSSHPSLDGSSGMGVCASAGLEIHASWRQIAGKHRAETVVGCDRVRLGGCLALDEQIYDDVSTARPLSMSVIQTRCQQTPQNIPGVVKLQIIRRGLLRVEHAG